MEGLIFNYFAVEGRVTNAFTDAANRKMKDLNRNSRGMAFDTFRAKVLFAARAGTSLDSAPRHSPFA